MPDERESSFKVTDRRKFNADGSPRDAGAEPEIVAVAHEIIEPLSNPAEPNPESQLSPPSNVVSFPGEAARNRETAGVSSQAPAVAPGPTPSPPSPPSPGDVRLSETAHQSAAEHAYSNAAGPRPPGVPEASFLDLLDMLAVQAALHLGMMPSETQEKLPIDLPLARHFIDMLAVIQAKTRGNLNTEEESSLESALAELRMRYVELSRS